MADMSRDVLSLLSNLLRRSDPIEQWLLCEEQGIFIVISGRTCSSALTTASASHSAHWGIPDQLCAEDFVAHDADEPSPDVPIDAVIREGIGVCMTVSSSIYDQRQPVRLQRLTYEGRSKPGRYREVSQI
jgi:hypothetical protein